MPCEPSPGIRTYQASMLAMLSLAVELKSTSHTRQLRNAITMGQSEGMQTPEMHLSRLVSRGIVEREPPSRSGLCEEGSRDGDTGGATILLMGVVKRSVSIDAEVAAAANLAAAEDGVSFSAWLSTAAEERLRAREGLRGVAEWEGEAGVLTREERAAGEALLDRLIRGSQRPARSA